VFNDVFNDFRARLRHFRSLIRIACVVAVAMASVIHVAADFRSIQADRLSVSTAQPDADRSAAEATAEACHSCVVVALFASGQNLEGGIVAGAIPAGRALHVFTFRQPATAPPPRTLT
jgi:hypothetical protein